MEPSPGEITLLLTQLRRGQTEAAAALVPLVYRELHRLAAAYMRRERPDHTLQPTALVNEVYMRLVQQRDIDWQSRAHFFGVAAGAMRRILVDHARAHRAQRRGGGAQKLELKESLVFSEAQSDDLIALDEALSRLQTWDPRQSRIVDMLFFGGLTQEEAAEVLGISVRTVKRDWSVARAWLYGEMGRTSDDTGAMGAH
ncbi:MAG: sigma-70 family RNA polymerase sigma factor [Acidobacteriota bacterium]|nr:sigma-70 family RNA polymerase sigma factor [Acidobacteriota bacterium]